MLSGVGKEFMVRLRFTWRTMFKSRYLLITNTLSGGGLLALGDCVQQNWENHKEPGRSYDWMRTGRMFASGCSMGPPMHYWYVWIDRRFVGTALSTVSKKVLLDQTIAAPAMALWYFVGMDIMEGLSLSDGFEEFKEKFWEFYKADWCVWPASQMISFYFLSPKFRVMYVNLISLGWDTYMSYIKHRDDSHHSAGTSDNSAVDVQQEVIPASKPLEEKTSKFHCQSC
ncbi:mpv17-like protein 2 [Cheilinus undulatus]|uniref:mpv17-like protein 2 n=1 Tax=Cheilinus undulatus TaxID=241271 RepID=UPI001BD2617C|nr:mpv17-like protein 2 [Cheilinus undulatus]